MMIAGVAGLSDHAWNALEMVISMNDRAKLNIANFQQKTLAGMLAGTKPPAHWPHPGIKFNFRPMGSSGVEIATFPSDWNTHYPF